MLNRRFPDSDRILAVGSASDEQRGTEVREVQRVPPFRNSSGVLIQKSFLVGALQRVLDWSFNEAQWKDGL